MTTKQIERIAESEQGPELAERLDELSEALLAELAEDPIEAFYDCREALRSEDEHTAYAAARVLDRFIENNPKTAAYLVKELLEAHGAVFDLSEDQVGEVNYILDKVHERMALSDDPVYYEHYDSILRGQLSLSKAPAALKPHYQKVKAEQLSY